MALNIFFNDANTVTVPTTLGFTGIYIPISNLPGMDATELSTGVPYTTKESAVIYSLVQQINSKLNVAANTLSLAASVTEPTVIDATTITQTYTLTVDYLVNTALAEITMIPVPTSGVYTGVGKMSLQTIFPNALVVDSTDNTGDASGIGASGAGVLISTDDLANYGFFKDVEGSDITTLNITDDNRYAIASIYHTICDGNVGVRTSSTPSAITSITVTDGAITEIPATYYASSNPLSNISSNNLDHLSLTNRAYSVTLELELLPQYLEVNSVTS